MGLGLGVLRLSPQAFWRMTPRELAASARAAAPPFFAPLERQSLEALMAAYPDSASRSKQPRSGGGSGHE
jgi:uncharacterized phage protein (TIGR02216 family)